MKALIFAVGVSVSLGVARGEIVTASNLADGWSDTSFFGGVGYAGDPDFTNQTQAQRFTAGRSGLVGTVLFRASEWIATNGMPLRVTLHHLGAGVPGPAIASADYVPQGGGFSYNDFTVDFSGTGAKVVAGLDYYVSFRTDTAASGSVRYRMQLIDPVSSFGSAYQTSRNGGVTWGNPSQTGVEIGLEVRLIPAPASMALAASVGLVGSRRQRSDMPSRLPPA